MLDSTKKKIDLGPRLACKAGRFPLSLPGVECCKPKVLHNRMKFVPIGIWLGARQDCSSYTLRQRVKSAIEVTSHYQGVSLRNMGESSPQRIPNSSPGLMGSFIRSPAPPDMLVHIYDIDTVVLEMGTHL